MPFEYNPQTGKLDKTVDSIADIPDVSISSAADHETLYYDADTGKWRNNDTLKIDVDNSVIIKSGKRLVFDGA